MFSPNKLKEYRQAKNLTQSQIANLIGIKRSSYFNWENGKTKPNAANLEKLAKILNKPLTAFESEHEIVQIYLQLNEDNQAKVVNHAQEVLEEQIQDQESKILYPYRVFERLSAGLGEAVQDDHNFDLVYFDEEIDHDIASWVYGDSMEPKFLNGSVALIKETGFDYDGAIYALVWDGQTYLKRVYREEKGLRLVSLNKKYADKLAPYEEEPRVVGKVVGNFRPLVS